MTKERLKITKKQGDLEDIIKREIPKKLSEYIKDVHYEFDMLERSYQLNNSTKPQKEGELLLEAFLLHARNLYGFFYNHNKGRNPRDTDLIATDFFNKNAKIIKEWAQYIKPRKHIPERITRISRRLSHLTEERIDKDKSWGPLGTTYNEIKEIFEKFLDLSCQVQGENLCGKEIESIRTKIILEKNDINRILLVGEGITTTTSYVPYLDEKIPPDKKEPPIYKIL